MRPEGTTDYRTGVREGMGYHRESCASHRLYLCTCEKCHEGKYITLRLSSGPPGIGLPFSDGISLKSSERGAQALSGVKVRVLSED